MHTKRQWLIAQFTRKLWVRAALFGIFGILVALIAIPLQEILPVITPFEIGSRSVEGILQIIATSMLTVTTFSLGVMVTAYNSASSGITPRATKLIKQEPTTHNVLASFIGAFLFSLVGIIALSSELYTDSGRFLLFLATLLVLIWVLVALLRWIEHLSELGQLSNTLDLVTQSAQAALDEYAEHPALKCNPCQEIESIPKAANLVRIDQVGHVQHIDLEAIARIAQDADTDIYLPVKPGVLVHPRRIIAWYSGKIDTALEKCVKDAITIALERSFDQDPRFGLSVLTEVASRALSPGINDPGTAIEVIHRHAKLFIQFSRRCKSPDLDKVVYSRLHVPPLSIKALFQDAFDPIARDGAQLFEVQTRLQKTLKILSETDFERFADEAKEISIRAISHTGNTSLLESQKKYLRQLSDSLS